MTVFEMFTKKYNDKLLTMSGRQWEIIQRDAEIKKIHPAEHMYMCLVITHNDIVANGGYGGEMYRELDQMHRDKLLASNKHRQYHGHVTRYWLTKKGINYYKKQNLI